MLNLLQTFAQDTLSDPVLYETYTTTDTTDAAMMGLSMTVLVIICLVAYAVSVVPLWAVFKKAGEAGWKALVPIYNMIVWLKIVGRPVWWIVFLLLGVIPFVGPIVALVASIIISHDLSKSFGKDVGITILLVLLTPIGLGILGWGSAQYKGPAALPGGSDKGDDATPAPAA